MENFTSETTTEKEKVKTPYWVSALFALLVLVPLSKWLYPENIPFEVFGDFFWGIRGTFWDWVDVSKYFLVWGLLLQTCFSIFHPANKLIESFNQLVQKDFFKFFTRVTWASLIIGIREELCFRWAIFLGGIVTISIVNFLFFGFLGFGIAEWAHVTIMAPIADYTTFGELTGFLFHPGGWAVGASLLITNATFRDGHSYQGLIGWINSWIMGMLFFYLTFNHGLISAMIIHALYDFIIFHMSYLMMRIKWRVASK